MTNFRDFCKRLQSCRGGSWAPYDENGKLIGTYIEWDKFHCNQTIFLIQDDRIVMQQTAFEHPRCHSKEDVLIIDKPMKLTAFYPKEMNAMAAQIHRIAEKTQSSTMWEIEQRIVFDLVPEPIERLKLFRPDWEKLLKFIR